MPGGKVGSPNPLLQTDCQPRLAGSVEEELHVRLRASAICHTCTSCHNWNPGQQQDQAHAWLMSMSSMALAPGVGLALTRP